MLFTVAAFGGVLPPAVLFTAVWSGYLFKVFYEVGRHAVDVPGCQSAEGRRGGRRIRPGHFVHPVLLQAERRMMQSSTAARGRASERRARFLRQPPTSGPRDSRSSPSPCATGRSTRRRSPRRGGSPRCRGRAARELSVDLGTLGGSALTGAGAVPKDTALDADGIPPTYVPARNTVLLSLALAWAEVLGAGDLVIGVNAVDYSGYPDCRPEYIDAFERLAALATKAGVEGGRFRIRAPLLDMTKADIVRRGHALGLDSRPDPQLLRSDPGRRSVRPVRQLPPPRPRLCRGGFRRPVVGPLTLYRERMRRAWRPPRRSRGSPRPPAR